MVNSQIVTVVCAKCNGRNAVCDTSLVFTSDPPKYKCACPDCSHDWFITTDKLMSISTRNHDDYVIVSKTELMLHINRLEERIRKLENKE